MLLKYMAWKASCTFLGRESWGRYYVIRWLNCITRCHRHLAKVATTPGQSWVCSNLGPPVRGLPNRYPDLGLPFGGLLRILLTDEW